MNFGIVCLAIYAVAMTVVVAARSAQVMALRRALDWMHRSYQAERLRR